MIRRVAAVLAFALTAASFSAAQDWRDEVTPVVPGDFPPPRPCRLSYQFGWGSLSAGEATSVSTRPKRDELQLQVEGKTTGFVRSLWRLDARHVALAHASTLLPISMTQTEIYRAKTIRTELEFTDDAVTKFRQVKPEDKIPPPRTQFKFPDLLDLNTTLLLLRSERLDQGRTFRFVVYPASSAYLATIKVIGREKVLVPAGKFNTIKFELKLQSIDKHFQLQPHTKFKRGFAWLSDDPDRIPVKAEVEIFVGSVWAELERATFSPHAAL